jgi:hypothetical protein
MSIKYIKKIFFFNIFLILFCLAVFSFFNIVQADNCGDTCSICPTPDIPSVVSSSTSETSIGISESSAGADYYNLKRGVSSLGTNSGSYSDSGLNPGTLYSYTANACNNNCEICGSYPCGEATCYDCQSSSDICSSYSSESSTTTSFFSPSGASANCYLINNDVWVDVSWNDNSLAETGYKLEENSGSGYSVVSTLGANITSKQLTGLYHGRWYYYRTRAYHNSGSFSNYSNEASCLTPIQLPKNLNAVTISESQINISWTDNSLGEAGFKIERSINDCGSFSQIATVGAGETIYSDTSLVGGTEYCYKVRAYTSEINSEYSTTSSSITSLDKPTNLIATAISGSQIDISWADNSLGETGFKIERSPGDCGSFSQIDILGENITSYSDTELSKNTSYCYRVRAYTSSVNSNYSNSAPTTTKNPPNAPSNLIANAISESQIDLSWTDNSNNEDGFRVRRRQGSDCNNDDNIIASLPANSTSHEDSSVICDGTQYCYLVCAYNNDGEICSSSDTETTSLSSPTNFTFGEIGLDWININWDDNSSCETGFQIERSDNGCSGFSSLNSVGQNIETYLDSGLSCNGSNNYCYRVKSYTGFTQSGFATSTTQQTLPCSPSNLIANAISESQIDISWTDNSNNETEFEIERKTGAGGTWGLIATSTSPYNNTGLSDGTIYYYRARACNNDGCSSYSNEDFDNTILPAPNNLSCSAFSSSQINLSWDDNSQSEDSFKIERDDSSPPSTQIASVGENATSYENKNLAENMTYYYRIRGHNSNTDIYSSYTSICSATTETYTPTANLTSAIFDTRLTNGAAFNFIKWKGTQPSGTHVLFQFASSDTTDNFSFIGPDGTSNTFYESSADASGVAPAVISTRFHNNKRYFRYKIFLYPSGGQSPEIDKIFLYPSGGQSPEIEEVVIGFSP